MQWWGWLIIGVLVASVVFLIILLLRKRPSPVKLTSGEIRDLADTDIKAKEEHEKLDNEYKKELEVLAAERNKKIKSIELWYDENQGGIDEEARKELAVLIDDPDGVGGALDAMLGIGGQQDDDEEGDTEP